MITREALPFRLQGFLLRFTHPADEPDAVAMAKRSCPGANVIVVPMWHPLCRPLPANDPNVTFCPQCDNAGRVLAL
jgi:hypothetical protein